MTKQDKKKLEFFLLRCKIGNQTGPGAPWADPEPPTEAEIADTLEIVVKLLLKKEKGT